MPDDASRIERERIDKRRFRIKDIDQLKLVDDVFNEYTLKALYELMNRGIVYEVYGPVAQGKEAKVIWGRDDGGRDLALKVYYTLANRFVNRSQYIVGDRRFRGIPKNPFKLAEMWCRKEFRNMKRAYEAAVSAPRPLAFYKNILVMEFIGDDGVPAPLIKDQPPSDPEVAYVDIIYNVEKAYVVGKLIHADLSEYNILNWVSRNKLYIIDWGSAIDSSHPKHMDFLTRDLKNINRFFEKLGVEVFDEVKVAELLAIRSMSRHEVRDGRVLVDGKDIVSILKGST